MELPDPSDYPVLKTERDFYWYKHDIDNKEKQHFVHIGEPKKYPCRVKSTIEYQDCSRDECRHYFSYLIEEEKRCPICGHVEKTYRWSDFEEET